VQKADCQATQVVSGLTAVIVQTLVTVPWLMDAVLSLIAVMVAQAVLASRVHVILDQTMVSRAHGHIGTLKTVKLILADIEALFLMVQIKLQTAVHSNI
jgi:hypothetical protein